MTESQSAENAAGWQTTLPLRAAKDYLLYYGQGEDRTMNDTVNLHSPKGLFYDYSHRINFLYPCPTFFRCKIKFLCILLLLFKVLNFLTILIM